MAVPHAHPRDHALGGRRACGGTFVRRKQGRSWAAEAGPRGPGGRLRRHRAVGPRPEEDEGTARRPRSARGRRGPEGRRQAEARSRDRRRCVGDPEREGPARPQQQQRGRLRVRGREVHGPVGSGGGRGIGVAVVDSGVAAHPDLGDRIVAAIDFTQAAPTVSASPLGDPGGHGTHVAGLVAGDGASSGGAITGVAPGANIIDVRVIDANGSSNTSVVLRGLQWILRNKSTYNVKVVNLSLGAPVTKSYKLDPLATAVEVLTFAGVTILVSAGNSGSAGGTITSPANDPFVISVGAIDDAQTAATIDDTIASFSSRGRTAYDSLTKPDVSAPGRRMVSLRSPGST